MVNEKLLEIRSYMGDGYQPVITFNTWRVAYLNYVDEIHPRQITFVERHPKTDEVFVLLRGTGILFLGEGETAPGKLQAVIMQTGIVYNVKPQTWHTATLSRDASVLIVENADTGEDNSEYYSLSLEQRVFLIEAVEKEAPSILA
jgi:ureidoglycolate hydrolase